MSKLGQLGLLVWKNFVLQKRKKVATFFEIGLPCFFALILVIIRQRVHSKLITEPTIWEDFTIKDWPHDLNPDSGRKWGLAYSPNNSLVSSLIGHMRSSHNLHFNQTDFSFRTEDDLVEFMKHETPETKNIIGAVVFPDSLLDATSWPQDITYSLRLASELRKASLEGSKDWSTGLQFPIFQIVGPRHQDDEKGGSPGYYREGFLTLQYHVANAFLQERLNATFDDIGLDVRMRRHPYPPYDDDNFVQVIQQQMSFILILSFIATSLNIVNEVVHEKERKLKETMKMMGLAGWLHWAAWWIKYLVFTLVTVAIMTLFFCIHIGTKGGVFNYSDWSVVFAFLFCYGLANISWHFMLSTFFSKANTASAVAGVIFIFSYTPYSFIEPRYFTIGFPVKLSTSLVWNLALCYGGFILGQLEGQGSGAQWSTLFEPASVDDQLSLGHVMVMLLGDAVIYMLIAWYVEAVRPGEFGVPQPWYFPVMPSYWCGTQPAAGEGEPCDQDPEYFERDPVGLPVGIHIDNLRKEFKTKEGMKAAVAGVSINMYEGQITALLGHNGAGKTTTMNMLVGLFPSTRGSATVAGYDVSHDLASVRQHLGMCPQHDVLFDRLTVDEHLAFFAKLKGMSSKEVPAEVAKMAEEVGLGAKRDALAKTLSGGMKRKLSVGIALIADSKVVILDEPTSGMDPNARRQIWDILQRNKEGRCLLLTTHFMDEADVLGDRIAIMAAGKLYCCGSPLFLKNKYGAGYHLVMVQGPRCQVQRVTQLVTSHIPRARVEGVAGAELSYVLPADASSVFPALFGELEEKRGDLDIASMGVSVTTMEEVFIRVGEDNDDSIKEKLRGGHKPLNHSETPPAYGSPGEDVNLLVGASDEVYAKSEGVFLFGQQFYGMLVKRMIHTIRNLKVTIGQLLVPAFFVTMGLIVLRTFPGTSDSPALTLTLKPFNSPVVPSISSYRDANVTHNATKLTRELGQAYRSQYGAHGLPGKTVSLDGRFDSLLAYLEEEGAKSLPSYDTHEMIGAEFINHNTSVVARASFNDEALHTPGMALNSLLNGLLRHYVAPNMSFDTVNHPLPRDVHQVVMDSVNKPNAAFFLSFDAMFGMAVLAATFTLFLVTERATKAKHIQMVSGVEPFTFWLSTFTWDFINYLMPCLVLLVIFWAFDVKAYSGGDRLGYVMVVHLLYGWAVLPFMYLLSFLFKVPSSAFVWLTMLNVITGIATTLTVNILSIPALNLVPLSKVLDWVFLGLFPNYCYGSALQDMDKNYLFLQFKPECDAVRPFCRFVTSPNPCCPDNCGDFCATFQTNYLAWERSGIGRHVVFMAIQGAVFFSLLMLAEYGVFTRIFYTLRRLVWGERSDCCASEDLVQLASDGEPERLEVAEDDDVTAERARLMEQQLGGATRTDDVIKLRDLTKSYGPVLAVDKLSLGIKQGECFGLLGVNGAGKTTTFKMMTGDELVTSGSADLDGYDVQTDLTQVRRRLGYCPQFDALVDQMTGREILRMYARLRGIPSHAREHAVASVMESLYLTEHADKLSKAYSGGNKRKLSAAIALIGDPPVIFLDEPSTGMDPVAKRMLWDSLSRVRQSGRTLVLTSHSMDECEALCTGLGVMVNGKLRCLGSPQHLKSKFGRGLTLIAKVPHPETGGLPDTRPYCEFVERTFPGSILKDMHQGLVHYHIADVDVTWARVFEACEEAKTKFGLLDYSVSQTTLEQVFLHLVRSQQPPVRLQRGFCNTLRCCCIPNRGYTVLRED